MGIAEIVGFAVSWLVVAGLMLWGVLTEHKRGPGPEPEGTSLEWRSTGYARPSSTDWIVVDSVPGAGPAAAAQTRLLAGALLASRGIDIETLPLEDIRTEVTTSDDGLSVTRVLVRAGAMHASRRQR